MEQRVQSSGLSEEALDAYLDGVLTELHAPTDPVTLNQVRAQFRKKVPLFMRSYAAAILILRAAGFPRLGTLSSAKPSSRSAPRAGKLANAPGRSSPARSRQTKTKREEVPHSEMQGETSPIGRPVVASEVKRSTRRKPTTAAPVSNGSTVKSEETGTDREGPSDPRFMSVFFSLGRRQRFFANTAVKLILEDGQFTREDIGRIRIHTNYTFVDIAKPKHEQLIATFNGKDFGGRRLTVNIAKRANKVEADGV